MSVVRLSLLSSAVALAVAGCGGGAEFGATGTLSLGITDAPVDGAKHVYVQFSSLELHGPDGTRTITFGAPKQIDLLALSGGLSLPLLEGQTLTAGHYQWIRLNVDTDGTLDTYLVADDIDETVHELTIPSNAETGLKLVRGFDVPAGGSADFTIDFDLRKSLVESSGGYHLKPVLRIEDNVEVGAVAGEVDLGVYSCNTTGNAVYVFSGHDATLADINTSLTTGPVTTADVKAHEDGSYHYRAAFLAPGAYTVALTCDVESDTAEDTESLSFAKSYNVTVTADEVTSQSFTSL